MQWHYLHVPIAWGLLTRALQAKSVVKDLILLLDEAVKCNYEALMHKGRFIDRLCTDKKDELTMHPFLSKAKL